MQDPKAKLVADWYAKFVELDIRLMIRWIAVGPCLIVILSIALALVIGI